MPEDNDVEGNVMEGQGFFGILVRQGANNSFDDNMIFDNSSPDIVDQTSGGGTSRTANFYDDNACTGTSIPDGLCDPIFTFTSLAAGDVVDSKPQVAVSPY